MPLASGLKPGPSFRLQAQWVTVRSAATSSKEPGALGPGAISGMLPGSVGIGDSTPEGALRLPACGRSSELSLKPRWGSPRREAGPAGGWSSQLTHTPGPHRPVGSVGVGPGSRVRPRYLQLAGHSLLEV